MFKNNCIYYLLKLKKGINILNTIIDVLLYVYKICARFLFLKLIKFKNNNSKVIKN